MMKLVGRLAALLTALAAAPVAAQPGLAPPPPVPLAPVAEPAPQNEDWRNVSHINGEPVKVGERGDYLYKWKTTNVATNPIGWMMGFYGVSVSQALGTNIALRGDANLVDMRGDNIKGYELGVSVPIYFKRVFQGPFFEPGLIVRDFDNEDSYSDYDDNDPASVGPSVVFGWHWTFDSGLNVAAAFGLMRNINNNSMDEYDDGGIEPSGYFRIGYAL